MSERAERTERLDMDGAPYTLTFTPRKLTITDETGQVVGDLDTPWSAGELEHLEIRQEVTNECAITARSGQTWRLHCDDGVWALESTDPPEDEEMNDRRRGRGREH